LAQLALTHTFTLTALSKRARALALNSLLNISHAPFDQRTRRSCLEPGRKDVPPRSARRHLELQVAWAVDELEHRVRGIVPGPMSELVYARVPPWALGVARREGFEELGCERGLEEEPGGFFPGGVRAFLP